MGRAWGGLCASCQRMYDFQSERLNFDFEALKPKESWDREVTSSDALFRGRRPATGYPDNGRGCLDEPERYLA